MLINLALNTKSFAALNCRKTKSLDLKCKTVKVCQIILENLQWHYEK